MRYVDVTTLVFSEPEIEQEFRRLDEVAREFATDTHQFRSYRVGGNGVSGEWIRGARHDDDFFFRRGKLPTESMHDFTVTTHVMPPFPPVGVVIGVDGKPVPPNPNPPNPNPPRPIAHEAGFYAKKYSHEPGQWSASFGYCHVGRTGTIGSSRWGLRFFRWQPDDVGKVIPFRAAKNSRDVISMPLFFQLDGNYGTFSTRDDRPVREQFFRHVRSPEALRDAFLEDVDKFEARILGELREHKVTKFVADPSPRPQIGPPPGRPMPISPEEEKAGIEKVTKHFARQRELMKDNYQELHALLLETFPMQKVWPAEFGK
ncbi:MAG: hypothetical protein QM775_26110 [Pirellulales bacterium]